MELRTEHIGMAVGAVVLGLGFVQNGGLNTQHAQERAEAIRTSQSQFVALQDQATVTEQHLERMDSIAIDRYKKGCLFVVSSADYSNAVSIIEGEPVVDWATEAPIPNGTVVCGFNGTTAVIQNGVASLVAFTGNQEVIQAAKERAGFTGEGVTVQAGGDN